MSAHLGGQLPALVDGELGHAARDRALAHLAHCTPCRGEVDAHRRLKARLLDAGGPTPPAALLDRLLAMPAAPPAAPPLHASGPAAPRRRPADRPTAGTAPTSRDGAAGPGRARPPVHRRQARAAVGGAVLAVGLGVVLALGAPPGAARPAVDPGSEAFLVDHAGTTVVLPLGDPVGVSSAAFAR